MVPTYTLISNKSVSLSDDDFHEWLGNEVTRILGLWQEKGWSIGKKEAFLKKWKKETMPLGFDAVNDEGEDSRKMEIWLAAYVKLQRRARY